MSCNCAHRIWCTRSPGESCLQEAGTQSSRQSTCEDFRKSSGKGPGKERSETTRQGCRKEGPSQESAGEANASQEGEELTWPPRRATPPSIRLSNCSICFSTRPSDWSRRVPKLSPNSSSADVRKPRMLELSVSSRWVQPMQRRANLSPMQKRTSKSSSGSWGSPLALLQKLPNHRLPARQPRRQPRKPPSITASTISWKITTISPLLRSFRSLRL